MTAYSFKKRFIAPIRAGLGLIMKDDEGNWLRCESVIDDGATESHPFDPLKDLAPEARPKLQTIRAIGKRRHARPGETLQLYTAMRTKQCAKIGDARCISCDPIVIHVFDRKLEIPRIASDPVSLADFAKADGFDDEIDMHAFWAVEHGLGMFEGVLIKWLPL